MQKRKFRALNMKKNTNQVEFGPISYLLKLEIILSKKKLLNGPEKFFIISKAVVFTRKKKLKNHMS